MQLIDLRSAVRELIDDAVAPYLVPDLRLTRYLNNAVDEACIRGRLLKADAQSVPTLCALPINTPTSDYVLDPKIVGIRSAMISGKPQPLTPITTKALDTINPAWANGLQSTGEPKYLVLDAAPRTIRLFPTPDVAYTLNLRVWRMPLDWEVMESDFDEPAPLLQRPEELKHWAAYEVYLQKDGELHDEDKAKIHMGLFDAAFGSRPSRHAIARWADSPPMRPSPIYF